MSKVIPVLPREQVIAKFLHSYIIALLGIITASVVLVAILHLKAVACAVAIVLALLAGIVLTSVGMSIDLARPLLDWTNPQKAIKQNLNVLFALLANIGFLTILGFLLFFLAKAGISSNTLLIALIVALVVLSLFSFRFLLRFAERRYTEIEV